MAILRMHFAPCAIDRRFCLRGECSLAGQVHTCYISFPLIGFAPIDRYLYA